MALLPHGAFDSNEVEPSQSFDPIPAGKYMAFVAESEMKPTKNGEGQYLLLVWEVGEGEFKGRKVWDRLNLVNNNQQAVEIAYRTLSAICRATGKVKIQDSSELHAAPCIINVKLRQDPGQNPQNEVKGYEPYSAQPAGAKPAASGLPFSKPATPAAPAQTAPATRAAPPWARSKAA